MKPKPSVEQSQDIRTSKIELSSLVAAGHELVQLAHAMNWERFEEKFGERSSKGRPGISTRLMVALPYLKRLT